MPYDCAKNSNVVLVLFDDPIFLCRGGKRKRECDSQAKNKQSIHRVTLRGSASYAGTRYHLCPSTSTDRFTLARGMMTRVRDAAECSDVEIDWENVRKSLPDVYGRRA